MVLPVPSTYGGVVKFVLRVTLHDSPSEVRLHLEGRLAGPWVLELELCWQAVQSSGCGSKAVTVDLRDVDFVDSAGERLLAAMHGRGAKFLAAGPLTRHLVREITGEPEETAEP